MCTAVSFLHSPELQDRYKTSSREEEEERLIRTDGRKTKVSSSTHRIGDISRGPVHAEMRPALLSRF